MNGPTKNAVSIFECGADLDGDVFYYKKCATGELIPVMINHLETWLDGYREALRKVDQGIEPVQNTEIKDI